MPFSAVAFPLCTALVLLAASGLTQAQLSDVTQPGDPIVSTSSNSIESHGPADAIDNDPATKYLNFERLNTGFTTCPQVGLSVVSGLTLVSANDAPERDPASFILFGTYDGMNFTQIASGSIAAFTDRLQKQTLLFENKMPSLCYKLIFPTLSNATVAVAMQVAEVELLGVLAPLDVTIPGDPLVALPSDNTPGSEGVANVIDDGLSKYLNFDKYNTGFRVTPSAGASVVVGLTLTSANDPPERDPASYLLEGANDATHFERISSGAVPPFPGRFYKHYVFFPDNTNAFTTYRLIFPTVVDEALANSMQIAEVELLGTPVGPNGPTKCPPGTLIQRQPLDTTVLPFVPATFGVVLTGPWFVQWYRNGAVLPGANSPTYVTRSSAPGDDGARYHVRVRSPLCFEDSEEARLSIFTPSPTESIGLNFMGQGETGPVDMYREDITGAHPQAYWQNLGASSGTCDNLANSRNHPHPSITVQWSGSGEWHSGVGHDDPARRLLDGMCTSFATNEAAAQNVTFAGVPPGSHSLLLYTVQVPLESFSMDFQAITFRVDGTVKSVQQRFIRPENGEEYNAAPGFRLVTSATPETRAVGNTVRFDNLQPDDGRIQIRFFSPDRHQPPPPAEPLRGPGISGLQLLLQTATTAPLKILVARSNQLLLSWPMTATNVTLEATERLIPPDWRQVLAQPALQGDHFELRLPFSKPQEYFRLRD